MYKRQPLGLSPADPAGVGAPPSAPDEAGARVRSRAVPSLGGDPTRLIVSRDDPPDATPRAYASAAGPRLGSVAVGFAGGVVVIVAPAIPDPEPVGTCALDVRAARAAFAAAPCWFLF